ncbi:ABC transporter substrate-binding protein [Gulosibacter sp. 10]|uniref:ABC transporter substrate-binding protein n=1 Tax=Gulosibacter sp. 10 TaxID=1255570 RepID=UPI00097F126F|nr:ABC transporter substrate-binding protein [Gulosibacter sp. 10]SJM60965.1 Dipeptide-binding ABC transporter, periplasmic substrate-binding component (TC 3.A.1.5.2) [Gulosibacter sp. 10]
MLAGTAIVSLLAGCAAGGAPGEDATTLRAAFPGGAAETLNYLKGPTALDYVRAKHVHAPLCELDPGAEEGVSYGVVESIEASEDLTEYTLHVRDDIRFTDGSPLTSADVLYSLRAPVLLEGLPFTLLAAQNFDLDAATAPDDSTVVLPALSPIADGRELICQSMLAIKDGTTEFTPDTPSSGPFTIVDFEPGQSTLLERNPDYYGEEPTVERIELISIADSNARVNALTQGQVDYISGVTPTEAEELSSTAGYSVTTSEPPFVSRLFFTMNLEAEEFQDPRVLEAFTLAVDRDRIVENVYFGNAVVGNDLPGLGFPSYDDGIEQRPHDPERARELLEEAGAVGMSVELTVGPELTGMVETGTLIVEDLQEIGVDATLQELPAGQLFADYPAYLELPFRAGFNPAAMFEPNHTPGSFPEVDALVQTARSSTDEEERLEASHKAQQLLWEQGNEIGPVFVPDISASRDGVSGIREAGFPDFTQVTVTG